MQHPFQIPHQQHQWTCMTSDAIQPNRFVVSWVDRSSVAVTKLPTTEHPRIGTAWNTPTFRGCGLGPLKEETFHCSAAFEMQWVVTEHNSNYLPATYQSKVLLRPQRIGHITFMSIDLILSSNGYVVLFGSGIQDNPHVLSKHIDSDHPLLMLPPPPPPSSLP